MTLDELKALVAVADHGSVQAAAMRLGLTQSAVSRRLQRLETHLGVVLLDRSLKPPRLTPAGDAAYRRAQHVLSAVNDFTHTLGDHDRPHGRLRLGVSHGAAPLIEGDALLALRERFPEVTLSVKTGWGDTIDADLAAGKLDLSLTLRDATDNAGDIVAHEELVIIGPAALAASPPIDIAALAGHPFVMLPPGCGFRNRLEAALTAQNCVAKTVIEVFGFDLQLALIARGAGLGVMPRRFMRRSPHRRQLAELPVRGFHWPMVARLRRRGDLGPFATVAAELEAGLRRDLADT